MGRSRSAINGAQSVSGLKQILKFKCSPFVCPGAASFPPRPNGSLFRFSSESSEPVLCSLCDPQCRFLGKTLFGFYSLTEFHFGSLRSLNFEPKTRLWPIIWPKDEVSRTPNAIWTILRTACQVKLDFWNFLSPTEFVGFSECKVDIWDWYFSITEEAIAKSSHTGKRHAVEYPGYCR